MTQRFVVVLACMVLLALSAAAFAAVPATQPKRPLPTASQIAKLLAAVPEHIRGIRLSYTYSYRMATAHHAPGLKPSEVSLDWDMLNNCVRAKLVEPSRDAHAPKIPFVAEWVRNLKSEWYAMPETGRTWTVQLTRTGNWDQIPDFTYRANFGLTYLHQAMVPFVARRLPVPVAGHAAGTPMITLLHVVSITHAGRHAFKVVYRSPRTFPGGSGRVVLKLRLDRGLQILRTQIFATPKGPPGILAYDIRQEHFTSDGHGHFFPELIRGKTWQPSSRKIRERFLIRIHRVRVNPQFSTKTFIYVPTYGSFVFDDRHTPGHNYRYGYKNPNATLGHDSGYPAK